MLPVSVQGDETQVEDGGGAEEHVQRSVELEIQPHLFYLFIYSRIIDDDYYVLACSAIMLSTS